ncbi:DUF6174 domain-containing protein [Nocardioides sp. Soil805]|uniref:DUF6174 domain-containing protein n=1 Tax=Nocardioides sp. Soil805 TaxID=1736416 RepID=UPI0012E39616|nr:DUF6174 domain-containing protein [Nocardioides sp. Soil805]
MTTRGLATGGAAVLLGTALTLTPATARAASDAEPVPIPVEPFVPRTGDDAQLVRAWERWQSRGIEEYVTRVSLSCFCAPRPALRTEVHADDTQLVTTIEEDPQVRRVKGYGADRLFRMLRRAYAEAESVEVEWTRRGLPREVAVDHVGGAVDDEVTYRIRFAAR